ncbi:MAG: SCP2 sterol-binding domain-containing protein [Saccharospirillaceae bacterium]|nr:SCP2 sterol-binding domain-containing protein [Pseudomonadales bacterium]NRB80809.1 SCP2 sterol-binding domain-containing protein [Saccharospirillaceae bacterium]
MFEQLQHLLQNRFDKPASFGFEAVYQLNITDENEYQLIINDGVWSLSKEKNEYPDIRLSMDRETFEELLAGELSATSALLLGRIKSRGDLSLAKRLKSIFGKK